MNFRISNSVAYLDCQQKSKESVHVVFYETKQGGVAETHLQERFKELMIKDSEKNAPIGKEPIVSIWDDSDDEKLKDKPSNNQMTLPHDEEFPSKNFEMNSPIETQHPDIHVQSEEVVDLIHVIIIRTLNKCQEMPPTIILRST